MLPSCLIAEPGLRSGRQPAVRPHLRPPLCVSHQLEVAFICFNLTAMAHPGSAATDRLVLSSPGGWVQSALQ